MIDQFIGYWTNLKPPASQTELIDLLVGMAVLIGSIAGVARWMVPGALRAVWTGLEVVVLVIVLTTRALFGIGWWLVAALWRGAHAGYRSMRGAR